MAGIWGPRVEGKQNCISVGQVCASRGINVGHLHMSNGSNFLSQTIKCVSVTAAVTLGASFSAFTHANPTVRDAWQSVYGSSTSDTKADDFFGNDSGNACYLCHDYYQNNHVPASGTWNDYGKAISARLDTLMDAANPRPDYGSTEYTNLAKQAITYAVNHDLNGNTNTNIDADADEWGQPCTTSYEILEGFLPGYSGNHPINCGSAPTAASDNYQTAYQTLLTVSTPANGLLANDSDPDSGNTRSVASHTSPSNAKNFAMNDDGTLSYTPKDGFVGTDTFTYRVKDNTDLTSTNSATVTITVGAPQCSLFAEPSSLDFRATPVGSSTTEPITLTNRGVGTCSVTTSTVAPTSSAFSRSTNSPFNIGSGGTATVNVSYSPLAATPDAGALRLVTNETNNVQAINITLSGSGFYAPVITAGDRQVNSTGYVTSVTPNATATDEEDGLVTTAVTSIPSVIDNNYRPGRYTITYTATDSNSHTTTTTQTLDVLPLVSLGGERMVGAGQTVEIPVTLNGNAPDNNPVIIQYQVSGTAPSSKYNITDGALTINGGGTGFLTVHTVGHSVPESDGTIIITLSSVPSGNAVLSDQKTYTVVITDNQISPVIDSLQILQSSVISQQVYRDGSAITVTANATDGNGDTLTYDWSASDAALSGVASGKIFTVDPSIPNNGTYTVSVAVSDATSIVNQSIVLVLKTTAPTLDAANDSDSDGDSDEDGIKDAIEGRGDTDGDGMPDYLDPVNDPTLLNAFVSDSTPNYRRLLNTTAGLRLSLGMLALQAQDASTGYVGAKIKTGDVKDISGTPVSDSSYDAVSGIYDFEIHGLSDAQRTAQIVIPLASSIPAGANVRKFADGTWYSFVENASDNIKSAASVNGECPIAGSSDYQAGLITFKNCLQLTMTDGGPNDADGQANGVISDPVTLAVPAEDNTPSAAPTSPPKRKSGGAIGLWWLLLGPVLVGMQRRKR